MVPTLSALSLALCHEVLEGGGNQQIRKKKLPQCKTYGVQQLEPGDVLARYRCSVMIFASLRFAVIITTLALANNRKRNMKPSPGKHVLVTK